ncbi:hypothetical protein BJV78DRAFT_1157379 [Lactifluus subvellereus]|nr:hypothetical protein BJV78DRAFT_1157379 [Lactifluus subvellereus]
MLCIRLEAGAAPARTGSATRPQRTAVVCDEQNGRDVWLFTELRHDGVLFTQESNVFPLSTRRSEQPEILEVLAQVFEPGQSIKKHILRMRGKTYFILGLDPNNGDEDKWERFRDESRFFINDTYNGQYTGQNPDTGIPISMAGSHVAGKLRGYVKKFVYSRTPLSLPVAQPASGRINTSIL